MQSETDSYDGFDLEAMEHAPNYHNWVFELMQPFLGANILEVGAGSGTFTKILSERCPDRHITAIEPAKNIYTTLQQNTKDLKKVTTSCALLADINDKKFDTIIYLNVMEHVQDDVAEIQIAKTMLNPGGKLIIYSPALPWLYGTHDAAVGHFRRYTKADLVLKAQKADMQVDQLKYVDFLGIIPWFLMFKVFKVKGMKSKYASLFDKLIIPIEKFIESHVDLLFGKNIIITLKNNDY